MDNYAIRRGKVAAWMKDKGISAALFEDTEGRRDPSVRYLSGQPGDSLLVVLDNGRSILIPWDINMASKYAHVDESIPYSDFERSPQKAFTAILERSNVKKGSSVELPEQTPYPNYVRYVEALESWDAICRDDGIDEYVLSLRAVKDDQEIAILERGAVITDALMDEIERGVKSGSFCTEADIALFIERELRRRGGEGIGFSTIAAGPSRSFGIHAFPSFTSGPFGTEGMSILDFGIIVDGYTTDVTMTFIRGASPGKRATMIELVGFAHDEAFKLCTLGRKAVDVAGRVDEIFKEAGFTMPHGLGHGIGLEAHEAPAIRNRADNPWVLESGHCFTLEPGLYDPELGGVRLENDVLMGEKGARMLTHSRLVHL